MRTGTVRALDVDRFKGPGTLTIGKGLELRVWNNGDRTWRLRFRVKGREGQFSETLGFYPTMTLAQARDRADVIRNAAKGGVHLPEQERGAAREAELDAVRPKTVADLLNLYIAEHVSKLAKASQTERLLRQHAIPKLGKLPLDTIRKADVVAALDDLGRGKNPLGTQLNRLLAQLRAAWNWALERELVTVNPTLGIKRRVREKPRERVLTDAEIAKVLRAADEVGYPGGTWVRMLFYTGARRDEALDLPWSEVGADGVWTLPAGRNKARRDHRLPLPSQALGVLAGIKRHGRFVFTVNGRNPYSGEKNLKDRIDKLSGVTAWTWHDVRRTVRSGLSRIGVADAVAEKIMNHAQGRLIATYNRHDYLPEMKQALQRWADHVDRLTEVENATNVVKLRA